MFHFVEKREKLIIPGNKGLSDVLCNHVVTHGKCHNLIVWRRN